MTDEQVQQIFETTPDAVPDYEVVKIHISKQVKRESRSRRALEMKAFGGDLKIWVKPAEGTLARKDTPVQLVKKDDQGNIVYEVYNNAMNNVGKLLEDAETGTSVVVASTSRGRRTVNGYIASEKLIIRSLPESILDDLMKHSISERLDSFEDSRSCRSTYHVVYRRKINHLERSRKYAKKTKLVSNKTRTRISRAPPARSSIPSVIYPEVMVVVDSTYMLINDNNIDNILAYVVCFWNGVDLFYRRFEGPKIRFNIARVIIAKEENALPYIANNFVQQNVLNAYVALEDTENYYYGVLNNFPSDSYDAVVTMTRLYLGDEMGDPEIQGISGYNGACAVEDDLEKVRKVSIVTEGGSFDGVSTAAHEFGHLLGCKHDEATEEYPSSEDGYIMATDMIVTDNSHDFSLRSLRDIRRFLGLNLGTCMYNVPISTDPLPRVLPGKLRDRDHQCRMLGYAKSCYNDKKRHQCKAIYCVKSDEPNSCDESREFGPPDGAFCSNGKVCLHGQCVAL